MSVEKKIRKARVLLPPFQSGQVWQMGDANVEIGLVGKRLVHYKHYHVLGKRPPTQLTGKDALERFLQKRRAILLRPAPDLTSTAKRKGKSRADVAGTPTGRTASLT
jgi:hypothetical protein